MTDINSTDFDAWSLDTGVPSDALLSGGGWSDAGETAAAWQRALADTGTAGRDGTSAMPAQLADALATANPITLADADGGAAPAAAGAGHKPSFAAGTAPEAADRSFADLAADVYHDNGRGADGWHRLSDDEVRHLGLDPAELRDPKAHFASALYSDGHGHYALAFRGTEPTSGADWKTNAVQAFNGKSRAYTDAERVGHDVAARLGTENLVTVGHSLGGGLADAAALAGHTSAVTFNAAGLSDNTIRTATNGGDPAAGRALLAGNSRNYTVDGEALTSLQEHSFGILPTGLGHQIRLADPDPYNHPTPRSPAYDADGFDGPEHAVWLHGLDAVREALDAQQPWKHQ